MAINKLLDSNSLNAIKTYVDEKTDGVSKTYTGLYTVGTDNWANANFYFIKVRPVTWQTEWSIRYRLECDLDSGLTPTDYQYMHSTHECFISGARGLYSAYANFNNINYTSRRVIGYHVIAKTTETGFNNGYGHMVGISLYYNGLAYSSTSSSYKRTIKITILQTVGCTATFESAPLVGHSATRTDYTKLNSTYYPYSASDSNTAGYMSPFDAYSQGLRETGDDNTTDVVYYHNQYSNVGSFGLPGYSTVGYDAAGNVQAISKYSSSYTTYTASISTDRVYNTNGFDWTRGLLRWASSGYQAANTSNVNLHFYRVQVYDFRYTDNCVTTADTTLSFVRNKEVYLRGTIGSDGLFYLAPISVTYDSKTYKRAWTQDIPITDDGYVYWLIGHPYSTDAYQIRLYLDNPLYWFKDGKFRKYDNLPTAILGNRTFKGSVGFDGDVNINAHICLGERPLQINSDAHSTWTGDDWDSYFYSDKIVIENCDNDTQGTLQFPDIGNSTKTIATTDQIPTVPTTTTANKVLLSTTTSGSPAWSSGALSSSSTKPLYLSSSGVLTAGSSYAGGTAVTLNNASKAASTASFYAPTAGGTAKTILVGAGTTSAPVWSSSSTWSGSAGFLKVDASGVTSIDTNTYKTTDTNYYPIRSYTSGLQISSYSGSTNCQLYVPNATASQAGVVTVGAQTFGGGTKTFSYYDTTGNGGAAKFTAPGYDNTHVAIGIGLDGWDDEATILLQNSTNNYTVIGHGQISAVRSGVQRTFNLPSSDGTLALTSNVQSAMTPTAVGQATTASNIGSTGFKGAEFTIGTTLANIGGLYIFTYGYCMILLPIYGISSGVEYKVAAAILDEYGSYSNLILTYKWNQSNGKLYVYNKNNKIPTGYGAYLFKVKLY